MNISSVTNTVRTFSKKQAEKNVSFKGVFLESSTDLGRIKSRIFPAAFRKKDALLLNEIAQMYPNQDCFIKKGYGGKPCLEYREKPPEVQVFDSTLYKEYKVDIDPNDKEYPTVPLILYPNSDLNFVIGVPSYISTNPSLPYTVKAGFEVHKKLLEKKYQIMDVIGRTDSVDFGGESIMEKAHNAIKDVEIAVTRFLVESAYAALTDRASARQIYESNYPKIQSRLDSKRRIDLTTSVAKQEAFDFNKLDKLDKIDICEVAMRNYPDMEANKKKIEEILDYMRINGISLENSEDIDI